MSPLVTDLWTKLDMESAACRGEGLCQARSIPLGPKFLQYIVVSNYPSPQRPLHTVVSKIITPEKLCVLNQLGAG